MRDFLFVLASTTILATVSPAPAQYMYPPPGVASGYIAPAPGYTNRGYMWREQRLNEDPRINAVPDRPNYETQRTLNNATEGGSVGATDPGECAIGFSEETCRRRGQKYNPPRQNRSAGDVTLPLRSPADRTPPRPVANRGCVVAGKKRQVCRASKVECGPSRRHCAEL